MKQELMQQIEQKLKEKSHPQATFILDSGKKVKVRLFKASDDGAPCIFAKGRRRYGNRIGTFDYPKVEKVIFPAERPISEKWASSLFKAKKMLEGSGLWPDILKDINTALSIGCDNLKRAEAIMDKRREDTPYTENYKLNVQELKGFESRLIKQGADGETINTGILWYLTSPLKIKKMNFGVCNDEKLHEIKEAMTEKKSVSVEGRTSYDVSFEYHPEQNKAWYSEEYRGCGNGHYYIALSATHAVFWEDD